jgi:mRNA interferase MazF
LIVAMITSNLSRTGHPSRISVTLANETGRRSGLRADSVIMTDNLATIFDNEIDRTLGSWTPMDSVDAALRHTFAL